MKKILWLASLLLVVSCARDGETSSLQLDMDTKSVFLTNKELPTLKITVNNDVNITLDILNKSKELKSIKLEGDPSELTEIHDYFYAQYCKDEALIVVVRQWMNTIDFHGWSNLNVLISAKNGSLLKVINKDELTMNETNEIISEGQQQLIDELKSGKQLSATCEK